MLMQDDCIARFWCCGVAAAIVTVTIPVFGVCRLNSLRGVRLTVTCKVVVMATVTGISNDSDTGADSGNVKGKGNRNGNRNSTHTGVQTSFLVLREDVSGGVRRIAVAETGMVNCVSNSNSDGSGNGSGTGNGNGTGNVL